VWESEGPPSGTEYNYPSRGNEQIIVAGYPAPAAIAAQIYSEAVIPNMVARVTQTGESPDNALPGRQKSSKAISGADHGCGSAGAACVG
jgi:hypothetical protein